MNCLMRRWYFSLLLVPLLASADATVMTRVLAETPTPRNFSFCWGGTCTEVVKVSFTESEWAQVRDLFHEASPANATAERETIRQAIGLMERIVGPKTGTAGDRAGTYGNSNHPGQLDCNDEATNSTDYLRMFVADGLVRFHQVLDTTTRGFLIFARHSTAVIAEKADGKKFVVDSWFHDNGEPAEILPLEVWQDGWQPTSSKMH
jgi:hypothetical protein